MENPKYDDDTVRNAVSLLKTVKNVSKVSRMTGIPRSVLTSWRDGTRRAVAIHADATAEPAEAVSREANATRAAKLTKKWDRSTTRSLDLVNSRLDQLDKKLRTGGGVTTDDVRGIKELAWTAAVGTDKLQILNGGATSVADLRVSLIDPNALRDPNLKVIEGGKNAPRELGSGVLTVQVRPLPDDAGAA